MSQVVISNGELAVGFDQFSCVENLYFPYVGQLSHTSGAKHRIGVLVDGDFSWLDDGNWQIKQRLIDSSLVCHSIAVNDKLGILLEIDDFISCRVSALLRSIHVVNLFNKPRLVKVFTHQAFVIDDNKTSDDSGEYAKQAHAILHYGGRRAFAAGGIISGTEQSFDQFSIGRFGDGLDGTWRDAEDGELAGCTHEIGSVDSVMRFSLDIPVHASMRLHYWLTAATSPTTALSLHQLVHKEGLSYHHEKTLRSWVDKLSQSNKIADKLPLKFRRSFTNSILATLSMIDMHGAILTSSTDDEHLLFRPRQAAMALWPLVRLGFKDEALRFFNFCKQRLTNDQAYLLEAYFSDGTIAPGCGKYHDESLMSTDDSASVLFIFAQYSALNRTCESHNELYTSLAVPLAEFILQQVDISTKLGYSISTYSASLNYAALIAASDLAEKRGDQAHSVSWRAAADDIKQTVLAQFDENAGYLHHSSADDHLSIDAMYGVFMFGLIDIHSEQLEKTASSLDQLRYGDGLYRKSPFDDRADYQASLWMAQYYMEIGEVSRANRIIEIITDKIDKLGGIDFSSGEIPCIDPRVSSEYANTLLDMITRPD